MLLAFAVAEAEPPLTVASAALAALAAAVLAPSSVLAVADAVLEAEAEVSIEPLPG